MPFESQQFSVNKEALQITCDGIVYAISDKYSFKSLMNRSHTDETDMSNLIIYMSSLYNEQPDSRIFPSGMTGTTFINCNLDNLIIPPGNTVIGGSHIRFKAQEDGFDWELDQNNQPIRKL